jgi:hypothetical protein
VRGSNPSMFQSMHWLGNVTLCPDSPIGVCANISGCKPGWQYVQSGQQKCDIGMLKTYFIIHVKEIRNP